MIEQAKGMTLEKIKSHLDEDEYYGYESLHQLSAELVLSGTHNTTPDVEYEGDYDGIIYCTFKSNIDGIPDIRTHDYYGTCSFCDTLEAIYDGDDIMNDLAMMILHIIQSMSDQIESGQTAEKE